jgi:hypothetical protein
MMGITRMINMILELKKMRIYDKLEILRMAVRVARGWPPIGNREWGGWARL